MFSLVSTTALQKDSFHGTQRNDWPAFVRSHCQEDTDEGGRPILGWTFMARGQ